MQQKILEFTNILRKSGIRVSTAEALDAFSADFPEARCEATGTLTSHLSLLGYTD